MEKICLVVCMEDGEYQTRFIKCMMNHYKDVYELHVLEDMNHISSIDAGESRIIIVSDRKEVEIFAEECRRIVLLQEDVEDRLSENAYVQYTQKYQEVYKIVDKIDLLAEKKYKRNRHRNDKKISQIIGVYSLEKEEMQIPFCVLLAEVLADRRDVLLMDLQPFSGLATEQEDVNVSFGLEDLLTVATTEVYTSNRLKASIGREQNWDYIYPVKNTACLVEAGEEIYKKLLEILFEEMEYEYVIINFGAIFPGMLDFMEQCDYFYFLKTRAESFNWREASFLKEVGRLEKEDFLRKIAKIEIPMEFGRGQSWRQVAKSWLWGELGDLIRSQIWMEN